MSSEYLCVDGVFSPDAMEFYAKFGVTVPKQDKLYTPRNISRNSEGNWEILVNEIVNPLVPIKHAILNVTEKEPAWAIKRFKNLDMTDISIEQIQELIKEKKGLIEPVKIKKNEKDNINSYSSFNCM